MATDPSADREHWNLRYRERPWPDGPSSWLVDNAPLLPEPGRALDIAGGTGRNALWLAHKGWEVTIVDVSDVGLAQAGNRADDAGVSIRTILLDLTTESLPKGPWDLVALFHYLDRDLLARTVSTLRPGGLLIGSLATVTNLERNPRPPRPYLLEDRELPGLLNGLELVRYEEGWQDDHHDARFVAVRPR